MAKAKHTFSVYEREALMPPPEEQTLRKLYLVAFGWHAPEKHGEREMSEAIIRLLSDQVRGDEKGSDT
jgi:hypothetical protein